MTRSDDIVNKETEKESSTWKSISEFPNDIKIRFKAFYEPNEIVFSVQHASQKHRNAIRDT